jgi:hypothetical protein
VAFTGDSGVQLSILELHDLGLQNPRVRSSSGIATLVRMLFDSITVSTAGELIEEMIKSAAASWELLA